MKKDLNTELIRILNPQKRSLDFSDFFWECTRIFLSEPRENWLAIFRSKDNMKGIVGRDQTKFLFPHNWLLRWQKYQVCASFHFQLKIKYSWSMMSLRAQITRQSPGCRHLSSVRNVTRQTRVCYASSWRLSLVSSWTSGVLPNSQKLFIGAW